MSADSRALAQKGSDGLRIKGGPISAQMAVEPVEDALRVALEPGIAVPAVRCFDPEHCLLIGGDRRVDCFEVGRVRDRIAPNAVGQAGRSAVAHHDYRTPQMGAWVVINACWYYSLRRAGSWPRCERT